MELTIDQALQKGIEAHKAGQVREADKYYTAILKAQPKHPDANHNMGVLAISVDNVQQALPFFKTALEAKPSTAQFWLSYIAALISLERLTDAKAVFMQAKEKGAKGEGFDKLEKKLLQISKPENPTSQKSVFDKAVRYRDHGEFSQAIDLLEDDIAKSSQDPNTLALLSHCLILTEDIEKATIQLDNAKRLDPNNALVGWNEVRLLLKNNLVAEAMVIARNTNKRFPDDVEGMGVLGSCLRANNEIEESLIYLNKAIELNPNYAEALINRGLIKLTRRDTANALADLEKAHRLKPHYAEAHNSAGVIFKDQGKLEEALEAFNKVLALKPGYAGAYYNLGNVLKAQGKLEESIEAYNKALHLKADYVEARAQKLHQQASICDWNSIEKDRKLIPELGTSKKFISPFSMLPIEDAPERHRLRSEVCAKSNYYRQPLSLTAKPKKKPTRIRVGYFSSDFNEHPVAYLLAKVLEKHDRERFDIFGYSINNSTVDELQKRLIKSFDTFDDVSEISDKDVALISKQNKIDIAVDLNGYTKGNRSAIFGYRLAPIQINFLGYPGTMGAEFIDYIIADQHLIPPENQKYFSEKLIYLPNTYMPTDNSREVSKRHISRSDMGLPDDAFVFCCFNNNYKITQREFDIWMRILSKVKGSVLWLRRSNRIADQNIIKEAQKRNIVASRLVFADRIPMDEHLARHKFADLFIDTFSFNAHTTASEALWMGIPVITKTGQGFAARVAGSLLNAVGLSELVTETERDYEALIIDLATNPSKLANIKEKLATNLLSQPLFNTDLYTRHLEDGYYRAYQNYFEGNRPKNITVPM
tara:strand:- start:497 stop:2950 length:2454 start_codon:yes stop_codon:yes gene_type:complete